MALDRRACGECGSLYDRDADRHYARPRLFPCSAAGQDCRGRQHSHDEVAIDWASRPWGQNSTAIGHVCFTPNRDIDCVLRHVRFAPKADKVICARRCGVRRIMTMLDHLMIAQAKTSNNIIQKGLAFLCKQSGSVPSSGR
jgi:hypothetical protein